MRRRLLACGGWVAFAGLAWMWGVNGAAVRTTALPSSPPQVIRKIVIVEEPPEGRGALEGQDVVVVRRAPVARRRVTLETLSDAAAQLEREPGVSMATVIQQAASSAGRAEWYTADWTADGVLDATDIAVYAAAFESGARTADVNGDGMLDGRDVAEFLRTFRECERRPVVC